VIRDSVFSLKRIGVATALSASVMAWLSVATFVPAGLRSIFHALCVGLLVGLGGFASVYSDDLKRHKPFGKEWLAFVAAYVLFILIFGGVTLIGINQR